MTYDKVLDNGTRVDRSTGATRQGKAGKGRFDLIPRVALQRLAVHYENGAKAYGDRNWEKGIELSSFVDSLERHLGQYLLGDRAEDHLAAIMWNAAGLLWTEEQIRKGKLPHSLNDLPEVLIPNAAEARASIARMHDLNPSQLAEQLGAKRVRGAVLDDSPEDRGYPEMIKERVVKKLGGTWKDTPPYTDLADSMLNALHAVEDTVLVPESVAVPARLHDDVAITPGDAR